MASDIFSLRIVDVSHYMNRPIYGLDPCFSEFRGKEIKSVPVIRIFGSTFDGVKTCLHIHGVLPYFYIPYENINKESYDRFVYQLCENLDKALNVSLGQSSSQMHHIFRVQLVKAFPFYGYHRKEHLFLKIYMYNPRLLKRASNLLQNGALNGKSFQAFDAHVPYKLQFLIDYNLFPMSFLRAPLAEVKYRGTEEMSLISLHKNQILGKKAEKVSTSKLEVDINAASILNRIELQSEVEDGKTINPGIESIWQDEQIRRKLININEKLKLPAPQVPEPDERPNIKPTDSELFYRSALERKLLEFSSQISDLTSDNTILLSASANHFPESSPLEKKKKFNVSRLMKNSIYPEECSKDDLLNATIVQDHLNQSNLKKLCNYLSNKEIVNEDVFEQDTLNEEEILNLSQNCYKNLNINDTITCEQGVLDFINQLEQEDNEERGIDLDSSLGPFSESQQNYNKEVLEFLRQLNDEDDNVQDQINNLSQKLQSDSEDECLNNYTVANEDIEEILIKLSQTTNCQSENTDKNRLPQLDGTDEDFSTPKKIPNVQSKKTPSPVKRNLRTPRSIKRDRYKPLQGIITYSPNKLKTCENSSDSDIVYLSSDETCRPNQSILKRKLRRKYFLRKRTESKSFYQNSLNSDENISISSETSGTEPNLVSNLNNTVTKVTCNFKISKNNQLKNVLKTQSTQIKLQKPNSSESNESIPVTTSEVMSVEGTPSKTKPRKQNKTSGNIGTKLMRSRLRKRINSVISNSELEKEKNKYECTNSFDNSSENEDNEILANLILRNKLSAPQNGTKVSKKKQESYESNSNSNRDKTSKLTMQPHVIANLKELGLCFLEEKNFQGNKAIKQSSTATDLKNICEESCGNTDEYEIKEELGNLINKTFKLKKCKIKVKRLKKREIKQTLSNKSLLNLKPKEILKRNNSGDCTLSDVEEEDLNICSFYDSSFFINNSCSMFSDADSPLPMYSGQFLQSSNKNGEIKERIDFGSAHSKKSKRRSVSMSPLQFSDEEINKDLYVKKAQNEVVFKEDQNVQFNSHNLYATSNELNTLDKVVENLPVHNAVEVVNQMPFYSNPNDVRKGKEVGHFVLHIPLRTNKTQSENIVEVNKGDQTILHENNEDVGNLLYIDDDSPIKIRRQKGSMVLKESENESLRNYDNIVKEIACSSNSKTCPSFDDNLSNKKCKVSLKKMSLKKLFDDSSAKNSNKNKFRKKLFQDYSPSKEIKADTINDQSIRNSTEEALLSSNKSNESHINGVPIEIILSDDVSLAHALALKKQSSNECFEVEMPLHYSNKSSKKTISSNSETSFGLSGASLDNTYGFKARLENLQQAKADVDHYYLTTMSLEIFVKTRGNLHPNPAFDEICAIFYAILNDVPEKNKIPTKLSGYIISTQANNKNPKMTGIEGNVTIVTSELELFDSLLELVRFWDPDILAGYEIEMSSWGYILDRSKHLNINYVQLLSRVPSQKVYENIEDDEPKESFTDLDHESKIYGRILLDVWRLLRSEIALTSYTFENVMYHISHRRIPLHSYQKLTEWYFSTQTKWIVLEYYLERVNGVMDLLDQLDLIGRTCEMAKLIGIQFYEILSRGSQYRVESMMLRIAKPKNLIPMSPSPQQRLHMRAPEYLPLILEPQSRFYADPLIVLDFQSLYPSIMIAYNYCFSTCLGRVEHLGSSSPFEFGVSMLRVSPTMLRKLIAYDMITISPCGAVFVKHSIREGVLPQMVREILDTRLMVKESMKLHKSNQMLQKVLHSRQLALKLMANVTYGYTAANFSGRMPCVEVGDSVVAKGRETLERAIKLVEATPRWGAEVVYGDTDSLFILCPGKTKQTAFKIGEEIAEAVTKDNPFPVKLKLEKVYQPSILQTKKRYVGFMYETPDQIEPTYEAKGIETVRRDGCPAVVKILEKSLKILFQTKDVSQVKLYVCRQFTKILQGKVNIQDLIFAKEFRGRFGYKPGACVPALELTRKWMLVDPRKEPRRGERVPYIVTNGPPGVPIIKLIRCPYDVLNDEGFKINSIYYITKAIIPALNRCFLLIGADVNEWFVELPRKNSQLLQLVNSSKDRLKFATKGKKTTISQYFSSTTCAIECGKQTKNEICYDCMKDVQKCIITLQNRISKLERSNFLTEKICQSCIGRSENIDCRSLDCPVLFVKEIKHREYKQVYYFKELIDKIS